MGTVMRTRWMLAGMLLAAVVLAGCVSPPEIPGGDGDNDDETGTSGVTVTGPTCVVDETPCAGAEITEFSIPEISVSVRNTAETPVRIPLNSQSSHGKEVLVSKCPQYLVKEFGAEVSTGSSVQEVTEQRSVMLEPGETLDMTWFVELRRSVETSNISLSCVFRFEPSFSQRLATVKQVQVRESEHVSRTPGLMYTTTAQTPVELVIDADDSVVQEMIGGEVRPIQVKSYLRNRGAGELRSAGYRNGPERIHVSAAGLPKDCTDRRIEITRGEETIRERGVLCRITPERIDGSQIYEIRAETTVDYVQELPPVELRIGALEAE